MEGEHLGKHRVKKFLQKWHQDGQVGEDFSEYLKVKAARSSEPSWDVLTYSLPQVDRIIDEGELADPITGQSKIYYLVKWNGLFYDASTWESEDQMQSVSSLLI